MDAMLCNGKGSTPRPRLRQAEAEAYCREKGHLFLPALPSCYRCNARKPEPETAHE